jgi:hypothetical protein
MRAATALGLLLAVATASGLGGAVQNDAANPAALAALGAGLEQLNAREPGAPPWVALGVANASHQVVAGVLHVLDAHLARCDAGGCADQHSRTLRVLDQAWEDPRYRLLAALRVRAPPTGRLAAAAELLAAAGTPCTVLELLADTPTPGGGHTLLVSLVPLGETSPRAVQLRVEDRPGGGLAFAPPSPPPTPPPPDRVGWWVYLSSGLMLLAMLAMLGCCYASARPPLPPQHAESPSEPILQSQWLKQ